MPFKYTAVGSIDVQLFNDNCRSPGPLEYDNLYVINIICNRIKLNILQISQQFSNKTKSNYENRNRCH